MGIFRRLLIILFIIITLPIDIVITFFKTVHSAIILIVHVSEGMTVAHTTKKFIDGHMSDLKKELDDREALKDKQKEEE